MLERIRTVLDGGMGKQREQDCRAYLMRLTDENLLLYYRQEAGLIHYKNSTPPPIHWGSVFPHPRYLYRPLAVGRVPFRLFI